MIKIQLPRSLPTVIGVGAFLKNTLCAIKGDTAQLGLTGRTLDSVEAVTVFEAEADHLFKEFSPAALAHDLHPDFPSTRWAQRTGARCLPIQHHHAHIAALMAEKGIEAPVIGLSLDGFGLGLDGKAWGGEILAVDPRGMKRLGHLSPLPQPGGDRAAREPWRMGAAALYAMGQGDQIPARFAAFPGAGLLAQMMDKEPLAPPTSSAGRLFDAACGLLGVKPIAAFEGEAPMALESMVTEPAILPKGWRFQEGAPWQLDFRPLLAALDPADPVAGANLFHGTLAAGLLAAARRAADETGCEKVLASGGCFLNKRLVQAMKEGAQALGLQLIFHESLSPGDVSLSLGQAYAAALMLAND